MRFPIQLVLLAAAAASAQTLSVNQGSGTLSYSPITAPGCQEQPLAINGAFAGDVCYGSPGADIGPGMYYGGCRVSAQNTVQIKVCASVSGTPAAVTWLGSSTHIATSIPPAAAAPTFSPGTGTYPAPQIITISTATAGATICYTQDGSAPAANGAGSCVQGSTYSGPVTVPSTRAKQETVQVTKMPRGATVNLNPSMSTAQIQSALNSAASGSTISFAAGTYNITSTVTVPCSGLQLQGPQASPVTATLAASFTNNTILSYPGGCSNLGSIQYLGFQNTGAVYFNPGNNGNFTFSNNSVTKLPAHIQSNYFSEAGLLFDGNMSTTLSNVTVQNNVFGDANSCTDIFNTGTDEGGYCAGVLTFQGQVNNIDIEYNQFIHVEEGVHFNQLVNWNAGSPASVCISCTVSNNYLLNYHRIAIEVQTGTPTNSVMIEHNAVVDPLNSSYGTFAVSMACCQWSWNMGTGGFSPGYVFNDNVLISQQTCGGQCPPYGVEFWGTGSQGLNSLVQGNFSNGYTWGFGGGNWAINNNYICGPRYLLPGVGGYITNQQGMSNPPSQSGNVTSTSCAAKTSTAPVISPSGGSFQGTQMVTFSTAGQNTGIWYTLDGSTPVPGAGTARYYTAPFTLAQTATVKAVGMWGNQVEPASYPSGYGYTPSPVVTATFTQSGGNVPQPVTLKAISSKQGFQDSPVSSATYTFQ